MRSVIRFSSFGSCFASASIALRSSFAAFSSPVANSVARTRASMSLIQVASESTRSSRLPWSIPADVSSGGSIGGSVETSGQGLSASPRRGPCGDHETA